MALLLRYGGEKIAREGYAPSNLGCKPSALLLRQRAENKNTALRSSAVRRTTASGLSPDGTELRTRALEMLSICGACDTESGGAPENRTLDAVMAQLFSGQFPRLCRTCSVKWLPE